MPAQPTEGPIAPAPSPIRWGRRAHDLPLLLARSHAEIAGRSLAGIRANPDLRALERAAEWDVQATQAEVRRWETEEMLSRLRADHARIEVADQVAAAAAQAQLLDLNVRELEDAVRTSPAAAPRLAHTRLMAAQTHAFLDAFTPLIDLADADTPLTMLDVDLAHALLAGRAAAPERPAGPAGAELRAVARRGRRRQPRRPAGAPRAAPRAGGSARSWPPPSRPPVRTRRPCAT